MNLSEFIRDHKDQILREWDEFASSVPLGRGRPMSQKERRNHGGDILSRIADDLLESQTAAAGDAKSKGHASRAPNGRASDSLAETHADFRMDTDLTIEAMLTEYRALRASVLRTWSRAASAHEHGPGAAERLEEMTRFNEAVDQEIAVSISRFAENTKERADLFIGVLGHEIRNPLGTISMMSTLLGRPESPSRAEADILDRSAKSIKALVEEALDFARSQVGIEMRLSRKKGDLADIVKRVADEARAAHPDARIEISSNLGVDGLWDLRRVEQLAANLLGNAARHGDPEYGVFARVWVEGSDAFLEVRNFGTPIPPTQIARVFEPFAQRSGPAAFPDGLGLGLHVCQEIARAHGGAVLVESSESEGTVFTARLPRAPDHAAA